MASTTTNYGWVKPVVGGDGDAWGGEINADLDGIDATVKSVSNAIPLASSTAPVMDGTAAVGTGTTWARADHVHPTDTTRYAASNPSGYQTATQVTTSLAPYAPLASPAFTGTPSLPTGTTGITQTAGNSTTALATTAFVATSFAPLASPAFTGAPSLPTGTTGATQTLSDSSTKLATTAFVRTGVTDGSNAAAGQIGEYVTASLALGGALVSNTTTSVCSINLTAGDWDVWATVQGSNSSSFTLGFAVIAPPGSLATGGIAQLQMGGSGSVNVWMTPLSPMRVNPTTTTTYTLQILCVFSAGTMQFGGSISARRVR